MMHDPVWSRSGDAHAGHSASANNVLISISELLQHDIPLIGIVKSQYFH
ncbi:hypothetical protein BSU04_35785 [Caballeronia sordidicola]|uniref:Uncharacterized protein n=1 Tax=Caballeronia sordidicola TaxID=196367 RepID=A0A226WQU2_CABSO|nr:hypothetical protein BSU04_35785 [Caballeronia sordidicola]